MKSWNQEVYKDFIVFLFHKYKKEISPAHDQSTKMNGLNTHTFYVQQRCNRVFVATPLKVTATIWEKQEAYLLLKEQEAAFFAYRNMLTNPAIVKGNSTYSKSSSTTSKEFLNKFHLGTSEGVAQNITGIRTLL